MKQNLGSPQILAESWKNVRAVLGELRKCVLCEVGYYNGSGNLFSLFILILVEKKNSKLIMLNEVNSDNEE